MDLAWISLAALLLVMAVSCTSTVNAGLLSIALAWLLGVYATLVAGKPLPIEKIVAGFSGDLFLTLVGVTLLFSLAHVNGTLERVAQIAVRGCRGNLGLIPLMIFGLSAVLSSIGAGNIAGTALIAPFAMTLAQRAKIPAFLMALMVAHGALAGAVSPLAPAGIVAGERMRGDLQLTDFEIPLYLYNLAANASVGLAGYVLFGGWRLFGRSYHDEVPNGAVGNALRGVPAPGRVPALADVASAQVKSASWTLANSATVIVIGSLILGAICVDAKSLGLAAFAGAVLLIVLRAGDERKAIESIPWGVILMVCGVTVLTSLLKETGGLDKSAELLQRVSTPRTVAGVSALVSGVVSVYSSTMGVVLPAMLPLVNKLHGVDKFAVACSIVVTGHLVDSSPLSTIGALCIASAPDLERRQELFNRLLVWGLSMAIVGAVGCHVFFGLLR